VLQLSREKNIDVLRQAAVLLEYENKKLIAKNLELTKKLLALAGEPQMSLALKIEQLEQQLAQRTQKLFGDSSEKRPGSVAAGDAPAAAPNTKQTGHGRREQPQLPLVEQIHKLDLPDQACPKCGGQLKEWEGQFEESFETTSLERSFFVRKHKRQKYRCACQGCVETALGPPKLTKGGQYSVEFAVQVAVSKYLDHLPLERQVRIMGRQGLVVDSQTLWDQIQALASHLAPAHEALHAHILAQPVIGADETHWKLMGSKGPAHEEATKRWQVWAVVAPNAVSYRLLDSRSIQAAEAVLGGYRGTVMADGYGAYSGLQKRAAVAQLTASALVPDEADNCLATPFALAHCWAHVRRKFFEIEEFFPVEARQALDLIGELYGVERLCPTGPPGDPLRRQLRDSRSRDILGRLRQWALEVRTLPNGGLGKAIAYMTSLWPGLSRFLDNPQIPLDNNATERALRGVVIGRKNHYGSRSRRGTEVAALLYSLCESAKLNDLDPTKYLAEATACALRGERIPLPHETLPAPSPVEA